MVEKAPPLRATRFSMTNDEVAHGTVTDKGMVWDKGKCDYCHERKLVVNRKPRPGGWEVDVYCAPEKSAGFVRFNFRKSVES
jgi:hypothetical protein